MGLDFGPIGTPRRSGSIASSMSGLNGLSGLGVPHLLGLNGSQGVNGFHGSTNSSNSNSHGLNTGSRFFSNSNGQAQSTSSSASDEEDLADLWNTYASLRMEETSKLAIKNALFEKAFASIRYLKDSNVELEKKLLAQDHSRPQSADNIFHEQAEMYRRMLERDAFMLILIDGDGMIFDTDLLRNGETGGRQAAGLLKKTVDRWARAALQQCPGNFKIKARIFANVKGLAESCRRANIISSPEIVEDFIRGFTTADDLFNFIDVGPGKDRANSKMVAEFKSHIYNYQCRHILFGCSYGNGSVRLLEKYVEETDVVNRVTLVEGVPFDKELLALPYNKKRFDNIFRRVQITAQPDLFGHDYRVRQDSRSTFNPTSGVFTPASRTPAPASPLFSPPVSQRGDLTRTNSHASSIAVSELPIAVIPNGSIGGVTATSKWANIARGSAHLPYKDLVRPAIEPKPSGPVVRQNKYGQRIDAEMEYNHDKVFELKKQKYCNQHYIGKGCCHYEAGNGACPHKHDTKLSKEDLKWLRVVARETVCKKGTTCTEIDCIYGHHCPYPKMTEGSLRGTGCINGDNCRFAKDMHGMDKMVANIISDDV